MPHRAPHAILWKHAVRSGDAGDGDSIAVIESATGDCVARESTSCGILNMRCHA